VDIPGLEFNLIGQLELRGGVSCYIYVYCQTIGLACLEEAQLYVGRINVQNIFLLISLDVFK